MHCCNTSRKGEAMDVVGKDSMQEARSWIAQRQVII